MYFVPWGSPRGPAGGLNVCWYGNTAVADKGSSGGFSRESAAFRGPAGLSTRKTGIFGPTPLFLIDYAK